MYIITFVFVCDTNLCLARYAKKIAQSCVKLCTSISLKLPVIRFPLKYFVRSRILIFHYLRLFSMEYWMTPSLMVFCTGSKNCLCVREPKPYRVAIFLFIHKAQFNKYIITFVFTNGKKPLPGQVSKTSFDQSF